MLSYRHYFHAGNHADVLKHIVYFLCLDYLTQKEKPLMVLDTHAGTGFYPLNQNEEWKNGVGKIANLNLPTIFKDYQKTINENLPKYYWGSPLWALKKLRKQDQLYLFEKHKEDFKILKKATEKNKKETPIFLREEDGFESLKKLLPPSSRRGLILMDSSYEMAADYEKTILSLKEGLKRFQTGVYLIWYPILARREAVNLPKRLEKLTPHFLNIQLKIETQQKNGFGLLGSGMFIINPPFSLLENLKTILPLISPHLNANYNIHHSAPPD